MATPQISNRDFRRTLLSLNGLAPPHPDDPLLDPTGATGKKWAHQFLRRLGFVQVDTVSAVERPQYQIPFSRNPKFRKADLDLLLEDDRKAFEHWTHDASILPIESWPYWKHYCEREKDFDTHPGYKRYFSFVTQKEIALILRRVEKEGAMRPRDLGERKISGEGQDAVPQPSAAKIAMEYLWRTGELAVSGRNGREKIYDLTERVISGPASSKSISLSRYLDWACTEALKRLGAATPVQIAHFFDAVKTSEAEAWCKRGLGKQLIQVQVVHADRSTSGTLYARAPFVAAMLEMPAPPRRLRLLSPFDPLVRDRTRAQRVFGFDYTLEMFVPPKKRTYGYYVLPILEGERFTGRLDAKVDRKKDVLTVIGLWWESGVSATKQRKDQLHRELCGLAEFTGVSKVSYDRGYEKR